MIILTTMSVILGNSLMLNDHSSRRRLRQSADLWVPEEGYDDDIGASISAAQIKENKKFIHNLKTWATAKKANSYTVTGKGIARLVEKIAKDGRVSIEDEALILETISVQRGWWAILIVMDTLICALATAMLNYEALRDNGLWSQEDGGKILFAYHTIASFLLYFTNLHLMMLLLLSALTSYIFEMKGILTFFVQCHTMLVHVNFTGLLLQIPCFLLLPPLAQMYSYGFKHSLPSMILTGTSVVLMGLLYTHVRPLFVGLYNEEYDFGSKASIYVARTELDDESDEKDT